MPTAAAKCSGPVSEPITSRARRISAASCGRLVGRSQDRVTAGFRDDLLRNGRLATAGPRHHRRQLVLLAQVPGDAAEPIGRPLFGSPARRTVDDRIAATQTRVVDELVDQRFGFAQSTASRTARPRP